jgi:hypothetical protein
MPSYLNWLAKTGPPAWLDDPRWYIRAIRLSLALAILGFISAGLSIPCVILGTVALVKNVGYLFLLFLFFMPGLCFGLVALLPLSRWLGREWPLALLAVPVSMAASFGGVLGWCAAGALQPLAAGFAAGFVGALMVGAWMGNPTQLRAWIAVFCAIVLASLGCGVVSCVGITQKFEINGLFAVFCTFQCVVAICLGARLWLPLSVGETGGGGPELDGGPAESVIKLTWSDIDGWKELEARNPPAPDGSRPETSYGAQGK